MLEQQGKMHLMPNYHNRSTDQGRIGVYHWSNEIVYCVENYNTEYID